MALRLPETPTYSSTTWSEGQTSAEPYWRALLQGFRASTPLLQVAPASGKTTQPVEFDTAPQCILPQPLTDSLHALSCDLDISLETFFEAAWAVLLARYSGENDIAFGVGRACADSNSRIYPVRVNPDAHATVADLLSALHHQHLKSGLQAPMTLDAIQKCSDLAPGIPLFESLLQFEEGSEQWRQEALPCTLVLMVGLGTNITLCLQQSRALLDEDAVRRVMGHLGTILEGMTTSLEQAASDLPLLTSVEQHKILVEWNDTAGDFPRHCCIHQLFEERCVASPELVAVLDRGNPVLYGELNERANRLAHYLQRSGIGPGSLVGICLRRSVTLIEALLAVLKAGAAYVPLDLNYPADRLAFMLQDSQVSLVLTQQSLQERLPPFEGKTVCLDTIGEALQHEPTHNLPSLAQPDSLAYIIFTSGSTGRPKGVMLRHAPVVNVLDWVNTTYKVGPGDRLLFVTSPSFDLSVYDIFGILGAGATVRIAIEDELRDPQRLLKVLAEEGITFWDSAPPQMQQVASFFPETKLGSALRLVFLSGDWIPISLPDAIRQAFPSAQVVSLGGATEAAIWSNFYPIGNVDPTWPSIPYGKPIRNARYHVLDSKLRPVPVGVPGELHIGGNCLADGYLNRPKLTAERFIPDPFSANPDARLYKTGDRARYFADGNIEFLGRIDNQVKVRGFRIELGEIESVLTQHADVRDAVVVARRDQVGGDSLAAYVILHRERGASVAALKKHLQSRLPDYMVPAHFAVLSEFPLTPNGKVDVKALAAREPEQSFDARDIIEPRNDIERDLLAIWEEVLHVRPISVRDNFFELGGHSFRAALLLNQVKERLGHTLPLGIIFEANTVEKMAAALQHQLEAGSERCLVPLNESGSRPPLFLIAGVGGHVFTFHKFARMLGQNQPSYGLKAIGVDGSRRPPDRIETIAAEYVAEILAARPQGPYLLGGYSIGALIAYEVGLQMQARGLDVGPLVVFDCPAPGYPIPLALRRRVGIHLRNMWKSSKTQRRAYLAERLNNMRERVLFALGMGMCVAPEIEGVRALPQTHLKKVWVALQVAMRRYRPRERFHGGVLLFKAEDAPEWNSLVEQDPYLGWAEWSKGTVHQYMIPGRHLDMFNDQNIDGLARTLSKEIEQWARA